MKKISIILLALSMLAFIVGISSHYAVAKKGENKHDCLTIKDGVLTYSLGHYLEGQLLMKGFDPYGYNYQAHLFNGYYPNVYLGGDGFPPYEGDENAYYQRLADEEYAADVEAAETLISAKWYWYPDVIILMKWNDAWLSNKDCDQDGKLDRHYGFVSYIGSGAWETNHQQGEDVDDNGKKCHWTYFVKIVAAPAADAYKDGGIWYTADGVEIGPAIWGEFAIIQQVSNDPCLGEHGILYKSPAGPGFGKW